jgi:hypothetical protein
MSDSRRYGEGRFYARAEKGGVESWYGRWYTPDGRRVHRKLRPKLAGARPMA